MIRTVTCAPGTPGQEVNPDYSDTYVFTNDFAAILPDIPQTSISRETIFQAYSERGICRVICFSPRHDLSLSRMDPAHIVKVIDTWQKEYISIGSKPFITYVQIFENKGSVMGCSNPHPHGQIWANEHIPYIPSLETEVMFAVCRLC